MFFGGAEFSVVCFMTIGLFLLGALAVAVFFGFVSSVLKKSGIAEWAAFTIILSLTVGVVLPPLSVGNISLSISGFLIPFVLATILGVKMGATKEIALSCIIVGMVALLALSFALWYPEQNANTFLSNLLLSIASGILVALTSRSHKSALFATLGGILLFEFGAAIYDKVQGTDTLYLGSIATLDVIALSSVIAIGLIEGIAYFQALQQKGMWQHINQI